MERAKQLTLAIAAGGLFLATPALGKDSEVVVKAPPREDVPTRYVRYSDLNLLHQSGVSTLNGRVKSAVRGVCVESVTPSGDFYAEMNCRSSAWNGARPQMDRAIERARQLAANGFSTIAPVTISISVR